jgi:glutathione S-transferase
MSEKPLFYGHPFSSYCQKVLIALYENDTPFESRLLGPDDPRPMQELEALWPLKRFPVLRDAGRTIIEASVIVEYLDLHYPGPVRLLPTHPAAALEVRTMDRFFDNYVMTPMQAIVFDARRPAGRRDPEGVKESRAALETAYRWLDGVLADRVWAGGDAFSLADCAAAPSLFYADWVHEIDAAFPRVRAYRSKLLAHPTVARAVDEARPYRSLFPLGAPDRTDPVGNAIFLASPPVAVVGSPQKPQPGSKRHALLLRVVSPPRGLARCDLRRCDLGGPDRWR